MAGASAEGRGRRGKHKYINYGVLCGLCKYIKIGAQAEGENTNYHSVLCGLCRYVYIL